MRICIPTTAETGLDARLSPHFGSAPFYTLADTSAQSLRVMVNDHARHAHGQCEPTRSLITEGVEAVVCRGLGRRALVGLRELGIAVLITEAHTVGQALEAFDAHELCPLAEEEACSGNHDHDPRRQS